jgi:hypothetical protein
MLLIFVLSRNTNMNNSHLKISDSNIKHQDKDTIIFGRHFCTRSVKPVGDQASFLSAQSLLSSGHCYLTSSEEGPQLSMKRDHLSSTETDSLPLISITSKWKLRCGLKWVQHKCVFIHIMQKTYLCINNTDDPHK